MNSLKAVASVKSNHVPKINNHKNKAVESLEKELKLEKYNSDLKEIDIKINNEILKDLSSKNMDTISKLKREKEKYGYHSKRSYIGIDFAIEFCNRNFVPVTKLEKLYFDKLYLYAEFHELLPILDNINDNELLGWLYNNSIDKKQVAINLKNYINDVVYSVKNNQYNKAINQIESINSIMTSKVKIKSI